MQHPQPTIAKLDKRRLHRAVMVAVSAQINEIAGLPSCPFVDGTVGKAGVPARLTENFHRGGEDDAAVIGFHDVPDGASPVVVEFQ